MFGRGLFDNFMGQELIDGMRLLRQINKKISNRYEILGLCVYYSAQKLERKTLTNMRYACVCAGPCICVEGGFKPSGKVLLHYTLTASSVIGTQILWGPPCITNSYGHRWNLRCPNQKLDSLLLATSPTVWCTGTLVTTGVHD